MLNEWQVLGARILIRYVRIWAEADRRLLTCDWTRLIA